jgi:2-dehydro-3-deoxyphosphogluconate aldolase/(4S)-4-hydroxy-2-oxoglutarate aldolase
MNGTTEYFDRLLGEQPVMAILRGLSPARTVAMCERAWQSGIGVVEVPIQDRSGVAAFAAAREAADRAGRPLGVGSVVEPSQVATARDGGADFAVSPGFDREIVLECLRAGLPVLPGVATASEIQAAGLLGLRWLKAFPAAQLTPSWIAAQLGPFPQVRFVATGGIDGTNAQEFLDAGARVVAVGGALADPEQLVVLGGLRAHNAERPDQ